MTLLNHYLEYITTPGVLLAVVIIVLPIIFSIVAEDILSPKKHKESIPGCRRLGMYDKTNLVVEGNNVSERTKVKALFTYPIKSCRGVELAASEVFDTGLKFDRLFTFAQLVTQTDKKEKRESNNATAADEKQESQWRFITEREFSRLALLHTELWVPNLQTSRPGQKGEQQIRQNGKTISSNGATTPPNGPHSRTRGNTVIGQLERGSNSAEVHAWTSNGGCLMVRFPFSPPFNPLGLRTETVILRIPLVPTSQRAEAKQYSHDHITVWKDNPHAINVSNEIDARDLARLGSFLGVKNPLSLFRLDERNHRTVTKGRFVKEQPEKKFEYGFADSFPVNILNLTSVHAVDNDLPNGAGMKSNLSARRFRANIYVIGPPAFDEDTWKSITVGRRIGRSANGLFETDAEYHVGMPCVRCKLPNVDPETGIKDNNEPDTTLRRTRNILGGKLSKPCLGMQMIPLFERGIIRVGDDVEVLERGDHILEDM